MNADFDADQKSRSIFAAMQSASLGTLDQTGAPFVSLVTAAPSSGSVVLLLSALAVHSKNLQRDARCSLLLVEAGGEQGDPLAGARLTLSGEAQRLERQQDETQRSAFLSRHPAAAMYADFGDFAVYRVKIKGAHLVAGFGRIVAIAPEVFNLADRTGD